MFDLFRKGEVLPAGRSNEEEAGKLVESRAILADSHPAEGQSQQAGVSSNQQQMMTART